MCEICKTDPRCFDRRAEANALIEQLRVLINDHDAYAVGEALATITAAFLSSTTEQDPNLAAELANIVHARLNAALERHDEDLAEDDVLRFVDDFFVCRSDDRIHEFVEKLRSKVDDTYDTYLRKMGTCERKSAEHTAN